MPGLPEELVLRFRAVALERLDRIEAAWEQVRTTLDDGASTQLQREVHTLKGESSVVGFTDVNMVCHKLEDLLDLARARGYAVDDDFDLAVNMAIRFMGMLVRKQVGAQLGAIDLPGFVRQIDSILESHEPVARSRATSVPPLLRATAHPRISAALRSHLGSAALDAFIEYAVASGPRRERLRASWHLLRDLIGIQRAVVNAEQLDKYRASVSSLARDLGKQIDLRFEIDPAEVTAEVWMALDVAALHLVRNAIDHGIEAPAVRTASGKPARGTIRLRGQLEDQAYVLAVEDDGAGIDFARVRARAIELGLVPNGADLGRDRLVDLMCHPGFSTRREASDVSGRGVGLDVVSGAAAELGGGVAATSEPGRGTTFTVRFPSVPLLMEGFVIRAPGLRFPVVLDPRWRLLEGPFAHVLIDLGAALGLPQTNSINSSVYVFSNGTIDVGLLCGEKPTLVSARRLVMTPQNSLGEVVVVDSVEGLWLRPEQIPGVVG